MLSAYLVRLVEQHADTLTDELVADLQKNSGTPSFHRLSTDELRHRAFTVYHGLGDWLADTDDPAVEAKFEGLGRQRFHEKVPLHEVVLATTLMKQHLRDKIRAVGNIYSALELHNELQLSLLIGRFFDRMLYCPGDGLRAGEVRGRASPEGSDPVQDAPRQDAHEGGVDSVAVAGSPQRSSPTSVQPLAVRRK